MSANTAVNLFVNAVVRPFAIAIDDRNDARDHAIAAFGGFGNKQRADVGRR